MLNIGGGEIALILIVALLLLGPKRMPELARGLGKFLREFRRQTDDVRTMVEREFYKMDQDIQPLAPSGGAPAKAISPNTADMAVPRPAPGTLAAAAAANGTPIQNGPAAAPSPAAPAAAPEASAAPAPAPGDSPSPEKAG
jgi:Tat protein translocase TatB subunit